MLLFFPGCAAKVVTYEQQLLSEADSLFKVGSYEYAKIKYSKIRDTYQETDAAKTAQFYLGYINVFYDNPLANVEGALREFQRYATMYPRDVRIGEVNSWIRILVAMQSFEKEFHGTSDKLEQARNREIKENDLRAQLKKMNLETYTDALKKCDDSRDSLARKTKELENVILDLERKCQDAGK